MKGAYLFQSVDKIKDSSKVYFPYDKRNGKGESGYIFQFYQCLEEEEILMFHLGVKPTLAEAIIELLLISLC